MAVCIHGGELGFMMLTSGIIVILMTFSIQTVTGQEAQIINATSYGCQSGPLLTLGIYACLNPENFTSTSLLNTVKKIYNDTTDIYRKAGNSTNITKEAILKPISDFECESDPVLQSLLFMRHVVNNDTIKQASRAASVIYPPIVEESLLKNMQKLDREKSSTLTKEELKFLHNLITSSIMQGTNLTKTDGDSLRKLKSGLLKLEQLYTLGLRNKLNDTFKKVELRGIPEAVLDKYKKQNDTYVISTADSHYVYIRDNCFNEDTRMRLTKLAANKGGMKNLELLVNMTDSRRNISRLLGYENFIDYVTDSLMTRNHTTVKKFLDGLHMNLSTIMEKDKPQFLKWKNQTCQKRDNCTDGLELWDFPFIPNLIKKHNYSIQHTKIMEYFPVQHVLAETLNIFSELFGMNFTRVNVTSWDKDVVLYKTTLNRTGELMGYMFFDLYARTEKMRVFNAFLLQSSCVKANGERQVPVAVMTASLAKPSNVTPGMSFFELSNFFSYVGHLIHIVSRKTNISRISTSLQLDFAKVPPQMMEYYMYQPEILKRISFHYKNHTKLTDDLVRTIIEYHKVEKASFYSKQAFLAMYDQQMYLNKTLSSFNDLFIQMAKSLLNFTIPQEMIYPSSLTFIPNSYAGAFYSVFLGQVVGADIFASKFLQHGILNQTLGIEFREKVMQKGGLEDGYTLVEAFLGRLPNNNAFMNFLSMNITTMASD